MAIRDQSLLHWPNQVEKIKQLYNQILVRHGVMLVGPTGGGKTTVRNILQKALILLPTISPQDQQEGSGRRQSLFQVGDSTFIIMLIIREPSGEPYSMYTAVTVCIAHTVQITGF